MSGTQERSRMVTSKRQQESSRRMSREKRDGKPDSSVEEPDSTRMGSDFSQGTFERHAALLGDTRMSQPMYARQRSEIVRQLQRDYGNQYVQRLVDYIGRKRSEAVQTNLEVGPAGDKYEQEADRVAKEVMGNLPSPGQQATQRQMPEEEELQMKSLQRQMPEEEEELQMKSLQRQMPEEEEELQMKPLQRTIGAEGGAIDTDMEGAIEGARGSGQPLPDGLRYPMENAFGADFSGVRVHNDSESDALNQSMSARAFTTGQDIFFKQGEYNPASRSGQEVLAHELTHVVQQKGDEVQRTQPKKKTVERSPAGAAPANPRGQRALQHEKEIVSTYHISAMIPESKKPRPPANGTDRAASGVAPANQSITRSIFYDSLPGNVVQNVEEEPEVVTTQMTDTVLTNIPYAATITNEPGLPGPNEFGLTSWNYVVNDLEVEHDTDVGAFLVSAKLDVPIKWGVHDLGRTDILNEFSSAITQDNYAEVAADLTPDMSSDGGRPRRDNFWASDLTERHEKFHADDVANTYGPAAFAVAMNWLRGRDAADAGEATRLVGEVPTRMGNALVAALFPVAEPRAYGDGAPLYQARADKIKKIGDHGLYASPE